MLKGNVSPPPPACGAAGEPPPPNRSRVTRSITCCVSSPDTIAWAKPCDGSYSSSTGGFAPAPNSARGAAAPNPAGSTIATALLPDSTRARAAARSRATAASAASALRSATISRLRSLWSSSTIATGSLAISRLPSPPNIEPKNAAIRIGVTTLTAIARRSRRNVNTSFTTSARKAVPALLMGHAACVPSATGTRPRGWRADW